MESEKKDKDNSWDGNKQKMTYYVRIVCVLRIKPFLLPVGIQYNQCPCRFFNPREIQVMWSQNYATEILRCHAPGMQ